MQKPLFFSLFVNTVVLLISTIIYKPFFEENDDSIISLIAEGAHGTYEDHLINGNIILGKIYRSLYSCCPGLRWHSLLQYVFLFISFTVLLYVIQVLCGDKEKNTHAGRLISVFIVVSAFYETYVSLQFSKTAAVVCAIGYIILLYSLKYKSEAGAACRILIAVSFVLLTYGILLRISSFKLATLLMIPVGLYDFVMRLRKQRTVLNAAVFAAPFAAVLVIYLAAGAINNASYAQDPEWDAFKKYHSATVDLVDKRYDLLDYNKYADRLKGLGVSENDAIMYMTWQFGDDKEFSIDAMKSITEDAPEKTFDIESVKGLIQHIYDDLFVFDPAVFGVIFSVICGSILTVRKKGWHKLMVIVTWLLIFSGILIYYQYSGRWSHRIVFAAVLIIPSAVAYLMGDDIKDTEPYVVTGMIIFVCVACLTVLLGNRFDHNDHKRSSLDHEAFFEYIKEHKDTLYVADTFTFQEMDKYNVFIPRGYGSLDNFVTVGSWYVNSPVTKQLTEKYGYSNPFEALAAASDKVVLVDNRSTKEKLTYLCEHYGEYELTELPEQCGFKMYRVEKD